jgi:hypothetical protein
MKQVNRGKQQTGHPIGASYHDSSTCQLGITQEIFLYQAAEGQLFEYWKNQAQHQQLCQGETAT